MTAIAPDWLRAPATLKAVAALEPARPLFVGGCVRDAVMGRTGGDIDIAVATPPAETMRLAEAAGLAVHPTGLEHGVVTIVADGAPFEVATLRRDVATDGRRAVVAFSLDPAEDAARRDFTMNALFADPAGAVLDPLGSGLADIAARRIRFIGGAEARIREDYLRILRFFRFHAQFEITDFDPPGLAACRAEAAGLARISKERIGAEMIKLLAAPDPHPALAAMGGVLSLCLPGAAPDPGLAAAEAAMALPAEPIRRLAALGAAPETAAKSLRLSNDQRRSLVAIEAARACDAPVAAVAYRFGAGAARDALALSAARGASVPDGWAAEIARGAAATLPIAARDLIAAGFAPGPALGDVLAALEDRWIASDFAAGREDLLAAARPA